jgi:hypothetical protein
MPSPNGTNHERLFVPAGWLDGWQREQSGPVPQLAFDAMPPALKRATALEQKARYDRVQTAYLQGKLSPRGNQEFEQVIAQIDSIVDEFEAHIAAAKPGRPAGTNYDEQKALSWLEKHPARTGTVEQRANRSYSRRCRTAAVSTGQAADLNRL